MTRTVKRGAAAAAAVVVAVLTGIVTNLATERWTWVYGTALAALTVTGIALQIMISRSPDSSGSQVTASGSGSVAIGGSASGRISTRSTTPAAPAGKQIPSQGVQASAPGSVAVGGDSTANITTNRESRPPDDDV
jgi:hypothetical protein